MKTALTTYLGSTTWPRSCPLRSLAAEKFCLMAVEVHPLSATYPSERTSWWGHPRGITGGLTGLVVLICDRYSPPQMRKTQIKPKTPRRRSESRHLCTPEYATCWKLRPNRHRAVVAWEMRPCSGRVSVRHYCGLGAVFRSLPVVGSHIGVCIMTISPPRLLPRLLSWTVQWVLTF